MTNTAVVPQITWAEIQKLLPRIQMGENGEVRTPVFVQDITLSFDLDGYVFVLGRDRFGYMPAGDIYGKDIHELESRLINFLVQYYQGELEAAVKRATYYMFLQVCKQIPYTQDCTCTDADSGLKANDCHEHNDDPMHYFGDFEFPCTCGEQGITR